VAGGKHWESIWFPWKYCLEIHTLILLSKFLGNISRTMPSRGRFLFILGTSESRILEKRNTQSNSRNEKRVLKSEGFGQRLEKSFRHRRIIENKI
jgi:hypothetical protein